MAEDDGYTPSEYYRRGSFDKPKTYQRTDSSGRKSGNLIGEPAPAQPPQPQVKRTSIDGRKPSRSEPDGYVDLKSQEPRSSRGTDVAATSSLYKPVPQKMTGDLGPVTEDNEWVRQNYYKHQHTGRTSFDRERMKPSNSLGDLTEAEGKAS